MSSSDNPAGQPLVFGVPGTTIAAALRDAGLTDDAIVAVLGRAYARSAGERPESEPESTAASAAAATFTFQVQISETAPECDLTYERLFVQDDVIDGVTVVSGGPTPDDIGFNARFHAIEAEFDSISRDLHTSSNCVAELRREVFQLARELEGKITEIDGRLNAKGKDKDSKEGKETKEGKEGKETKEKDTKEGKDKEGKDHKDGKDGFEKAVRQEKFAGLEKQLDRPLSQVPGQPAGPPRDRPGEARTFITLEDRPDVEAAALRSDERPTNKTPANETTATKAVARKSTAKKAGDSRRGSAER
jgi:hypothetical protein